MLPARLLVHEVVWQRPAYVTDDYGNTNVPDWTTPVTSTIRGRMSQANLRQSENTNGRQAVEAEWLLMTNQLGIGPADRVQWADATYEVAGQPARVAGAGPNHHLEVPLRVVV